MKRLLRRSSPSSGRKVSAPLQEMRLAREAARQRLNTASPKNLDVFMAAVRYDDENSYWNELAQVIAGWGEPVLPALGKSPGDSEPRVRRTVAMALGDMPLKTMPDVMPKLLHDPEASVRDTATPLLDAHGWTRFSIQRPPHCTDNRNAQRRCSAAAGNPVGLAVGSPAVVRGRFDAGRDRPRQTGGRAALIRILKESTDRMHVTTSLAPSADSQAKSATTRRSSRSFRPWPTPSRTTRTTSSADARRLFLAISAPAQKRRCLR